jgi:hypothetical protein
VEDSNFTATKESTTSSKQSQFDFGLFFDIEGIVHKEFVPPGKTLNGKFCSNALRRLRENIWHQCTDKWHNNSWALHHDNAPAHVSFLVQQLLGFYDSHPPPFLLTRPCPCDFFPIPEDEIETQGVTF